MLLLSLPPPPIKVFWSFSLTNKRGLKRPSPTFSSTKPPPPSPFSPPNISFHFPFRGRPWYVKGKGEWWEMVGCGSSTKLEPLPRLVPESSVAIKNPPHPTWVGGKGGVEWNQRKSPTLEAEKKNLAAIFLGWKSYNRHRECKAVNVLFFIHLKTFSFLENEEKTVSLLLPHFVRRHRPIGFLLPLLLSFRSWVWLEKEKKEKERTSFFLFFPLFSCFSALSIILSNFSPSLLLNKKNQGGW